MRNTNILIIGGAISNNEGATAMTLLTINLLKEILSNPQIKINSPYFYSCLDRSKKLNIEIIDPHKKKRFLDYKNTDLIIDLSGDMYSDDYGIKSTISYFKGLYIKLLFKKPIIIFPQSIGPFNTKLTKRLAKFVFNHCNVVIPREQITHDLLKEMKIKTLHPIIDDTAFLLNPSSEQEIKKIMKKENIIKEKGKRLIGLSLSQSIATYSKCETNSKYEEYVKKMVSLVDYLTSKLNANLIFIPHVGGEENKANDDRIMCNLVYSKAKDKEKIRIMQKERYWPQEFKGVISKCDLFIGSRMHANIAALSTNVPTIAIAYSHKTYGIMERFNQEKYVCDIMKLSEKELINKINDALKNKKKIIEQLKEKNEKVKGNKEVLKKIILDALENDKKFNKRNNK
jgi:colanic acid/amylovoran biosynthesis protein